VGLEVSNIVQVIKSTNGTQTYQLGSRNASTNLRLKDGETQVLAGLIADEDRTGATKVPLFGDLPLLGRLFSNQRDELSKTEIVLLITPRIIRNIERPELADGEFFGGTESAASDQSLQLRPVPGLPPVPSRPGLRQIAPGKPVQLPVSPAQPPAGSAQPPAGSAQPPADSGEPVELEAEPDPDPGVEQAEQPGTAPAQ
jgi:general secretion pathway protein D